MKPHPSGIIRLLLFALVSASAGFEGACASVVASASPRTVLDLDGDWRFSKGDLAAAMVPAFDDSAWRAVDLPHDWSSEGPFSADYGSGNGFAPGGVNHQGIDNKLIQPPASLPEAGRIRCQKELGGMLNYYYRQAA